MYIVTLKIFDKDTNDVTNQATFKWFDENAHYLITRSFINSTCWQVQMGNILNFDESLFYYKDNYLSK